MATLARRPLAPEHPTAHFPSQPPGEWGLLLIPVLLCVGMLIFALAAQTLPAASEVPGSRSCIPTSRLGPTGHC